MHIKDAPTNFTEFLLWFKNRTEHVWATYKTQSLDDFKRRGVGGKDWLQGTKWSGGYSSDEIAAFEQTWQLQFPADFKQFLETLGTPDRKIFSVRYRGDELIADENGFSFYDWRDGAQIQCAYDFLLDGLLFDVEHNNLWLNGWGQKPESLEERRAIVTNALHLAPRLIPIFSHRFLLSEPLQSGNPVLSVMQTDVIVYGHDMRAYLINEFHQLLNITLDEMPSANSKQDKESWYQNFIRSTPFWGELISGGDRL